MYDRQSVDSKNKKGRYYNMSFKFDDQTRAGYPI